MGEQKVFQHIEIKISKVAVTLVVWRNLAGVYVGIPTVKNGGKKVAYKEQLDVGPFWLQNFTEMLLMWLHLQVHYGIFWLVQSKQLLRTPLNTENRTCSNTLAATFALASTYIFFYKSSLYRDSVLIMQKWKAHQQQTTHNRCLILLN